MNRPDHLLDATFFAVGSCRGPGRLAARQAGWRTLRFPALAVLLRHATRGYVLYDTGYAPRYFDVLRRWPYRLLGPALGARLLPGEGLATQMLARCGVDPAAVRTVIVSHFHLDHIAGLRDFPAAEIVCTEEALASVRGLRGGWRAARQVFHPDLLPEDFAARVQRLPSRDAEPSEGFARTWDVFGDRSLRAVALPGHAAGQAGLRFRCKGTEYFLVADACWHAAALSGPDAPPGRAERWFSADPDAGQATRRALQAYRREHPSVRVVPSHCPHTVALQIAAFDS